MASARFLPTTINRATTAGKLWRTFGAHVFLVVLLRWTSPPARAVAGLRPWNVGSQFAAQRPAGTVALRVASGRFGSGMSSIRVHLRPSTVPMHGTNGFVFQRCQAGQALIAARAGGPAQPLPLPSGTGRSARKNSKHRRRGTSSSLSKNFFAGWVLASCGAPSVLNCFICIVFRRTSPPARAVSDLRPRWLRVVNDLSRHQLQRLGRSLTLPPADMPSPLRSSCRFKKRRQNPAQRLLVESI